MGSTATDETWSCESEVGPDPESIPAGFSVFLSHPNPESLFKFGSSRSLRGHFLSKNMSKFRLDWWKQESEQEPDSQIWKFTDPDLD